jgi:hypothetical protein
VLERGKEIKKFRRNMQFKKKKRKKTAGNPKEGNISKRKE